MPQPSRPHEACPLATGPAPLQVGQPPGPPSAGAATAFGAGVSSAAVATADPPSRAARASARTANRRANERSVITWTPFHGVQSHRPGFDSVRTQRRIGAFIIPPPAAPAYGPLVIPL